MSWKTLIGSMCGFVLIVGAGLGLLSGRLGQPMFLTGWLTWLVLIGLSAVWWWPARDLGHLASRLRTQAIVGGPLIGATVVHVGFRWPTGWVDGLLTLVFVAFLLSTLAGVALVARSGTQPDRVSRWLDRHTALAFSATGLALFHGVYVHAHGLFAFLAGGQ